MIDQGWPPIADIVSHKSDMLLLDRITGEEGAVLRVSASITDGHLFLVSGFGVPGWMGFELMAQAVAAHDGLTGWRRGEPPKLGFLVACREYACVAEWFLPGDRLDIAVWPTMEPGEIMMWASTIHRDGAEIAKAEIMVHQPRDVDAFIAKARAL